MNIDSAIMIIFIWIILIILSKLFIKKHTWTHWICKGGTFTHIIITLVTSSLIIVIKYFVNLHLKFEKLLPMFIKFSNQLHFQILNLTIVLLSMVLIVQFNFLEFSMNKRVQLLQHQRHHLFHHTIYSSLNHLIKIGLQIRFANVAGILIIIWRHRIFYHEKFIIFKICRETWRLYFCFNVRWCAFRWLNHICC